MKTMTKSKRLTAHHPSNSNLKQRRITRKSVLRMLKLMSTSDEDGSDTVQDFLTTGRVGRRNALPDILSDHALTNTADLPDKLMQLSTNECGETSSKTQHEERAAGDGSDEKKGSS